MVLSNPTAQTSQMIFLDGCYMVNIWEQPCNISTLITQSWLSLLK